MDSDTNIQNELGVPPVPPMPDGGNMPDGSTLDLSNPLDAMAAELENGETQPIGEPINEPVEPVNEPIPTPTPSTNNTKGQNMDNNQVSGDLESVKKSMLKDLFPLMDRVNVTPEQRFKIYHEMIEDTGDKSLITAAYEAVKSIADETARAEALLFLVEASEK